MTLMLEFAYKDLKSNIMKYGKENTLGMKEKWRNHSREKKICNEWLHGEINKMTFPFVWKCKVTEYSK